MLQVIGRAIAFIETARAAFARHCVLFARSGDSASRLVEIARIVVEKLRRATMRPVGGARWRAADDRRDEPLCVERALPHGRV